MPPNFLAINSIAILADSASSEPTKASGLDFVEELTFTIGIPAFLALSIAGELASNSHGFKMIASTCWLMKLSTCSTCFKEDLSASTIINSTWLVAADFSNASATCWINSFCMLNIETPIIILSDFFSLQEKPSINIQANNTYFNFIYSFLIFDTNRLKRLLR